MGVFDVKFESDNDIKSIVKALNELDKKLKNKALNKALRQSAKPTLNMARFEAKTNDSEEATGATSKGIKLKTKKLKRGLKGVHAVFITTPTRAQLAKLNPKYDGEKMYYPAVQMYGSTKINLSANDFMAKAFDGTKDLVFRNFKIKAWELLKKT